MHGLFAGCSNLKSVDVSHFDTSHVYDMGEMFRGCSSLTALNLANFDTHNATNMGGMFCGCSNLKDLDVTSFDTSKAVDMGGGVYQDDDSTGAPWRTDGRGGMFQNCTSLESLDLSSFDTAKVSEMMSMFSGCTNLKYIYVSDRWTISGLDDFSKHDNYNANLKSIGSSGNMFSKCENLSGFDSSAVDASRAYYGLKDGVTGYLTYKAAPTK